MIEDFVKYVPKPILEESGAVFYSGRAAFSNPARLYILGFNPGGSAEKLADYTMDKHIKLVLDKKPNEWSEYCDECWKGAPGTSGLQPRILHMLGRLNMNPRHVPSSNVVFVRSQSEKKLGDRFENLANDCWSFHENVIDKLGVKVILCFGQKAGYWIVKKLKANQKVGEFVEKNNRGWRTVALSSSQGIVVVIAAHPSRSNWRNRKCDPTDLVRDVLNNVHL